MHEDAGGPGPRRDGGRTLRDVAAEAIRVGFPVVNVITNGTHGLELPEADLILVSRDGTREHHDAIRGRTFDTALASIEAAST